MYRSWDSYTNPDNYKSVTVDDRYEVFLARFGYSPNFEGTTPVINQYKLFPFFRNDEFLAKFFRKKRYLGAYGGRPPLWVAIKALKDAQAEVTADQQALQKLQAALTADKDKSNRVQNTQQMGNKLVLNNGNGKHTIIFNDTVNGSTNSTITNKPNVNNNNVSYSDITTNTASNSDAQQAATTANNQNVQSQQLSLFDKQGELNQAMLPTNNAKTLPTTGDDNNNHSMIAGILTTIAGALGILGLADTKRKHN